MFRVDTVAHCPRTAVLVFVLEELEAEYEVRTLASGWFAERERVGPLLVHDELEVPELFAAMRFACALTGRLLPASLGDRTRVDCWLELYASTLRPAIQRLVAQSDELARTAFRRGIVQLERAVAGKSWLLDEFSVADVPAIQLVALQQRGVVSFDAQPELRGYLARVAGRPAWGRVEARLGHMLGGLPSGAPHSMG